MPTALRYATLMQLRGLHALLLLTAAATAQRGAVERLVRDAEAQGVRVGVACTDGGGEVLYRHRAAESFAPASNMKVLTACGLLHGLGHDHVFRTAFSLEDGVLAVDASGDPNWIRDTEHDPARVFAQLAAALRVRGIDSIRDVRLRPGTYVGPARPSDWPQDQLYAYYCAPTGAFVLDQGVFWVALQPAGGQARCELVSPATGYPLRGTVDVVGKQKSPVYGAVDKVDHVQVRGRMHASSPRVEIRQSVEEPERWFRDALRHALAQGGITIDAGAPARTSADVFVHESSLLPAVRRILEDSSNFDAEQCLRVLGAKRRGDGSLAGGMREFEEQITRLCGRLPSNTVLTDGSGLSRTNRLTPGLLVVAMLQNAATASGSVLRDRLPVAGESGTLERRFVGTPLVGRVRAKTGWIRGASSLSGVLDCVDGGKRWFSILMDYDRDRSGFNKELKQIQEDLVAAFEGLEADQ